MKTLHILTYHKIDTLRELGINVVSPRRFESHLMALQDAGYVGIAPSVLRETLETGRPLPERSILLTFDDGYANFAEYAWDICQKYGFPAVVFPISSYIGRENLWDKTVTRFRHLNWSQLRELASAGVVIGAHTVSHPFLPHLSNERAFAEMADSKKALEDGLGIPVSLFSYPYGDWTPTVAKLAEYAGFEMTFSLDPRLPATWENRFALPRMAIYGIDSPKAVLTKVGVHGETAWERECAKNRIVNRFAYANRLWNSP